jgi:ubiquinone/menaquinone biosynthesis C-methylase UbiE
MASEMIRQSGWEKWHDWYARMMQPISAWFCEATAARPGLIVLDAACGTGVPALALAACVRPDGKVVATDISAEMVGAARRKAAAAGASNIEHREMDVAALDFADASFDAVTCKDGLIYCPDPSKGARELHRVLKPGGRFAITAWDEPANNPFFTTMFETLGRFIQRPPPDPNAPGPFRLARPGELENVLRKAGFTNIAIERREVAFAFDSLAMHWESVNDMAAPVAAAVATLSGSEVARLKQALADALKPYTSNRGVRLPNTALCASGSR